MGQDLEGSITRDAYSRIVDNQKVPALRSTPTGIQAILTVIGRRTVPPTVEGEYRLDFHNHLFWGGRSAGHRGGGSTGSGAFLIEGAGGGPQRGASGGGEPLRGASGGDLSEAHLEGADLMGGVLGAGALRCGSY